MSQDETQPLAIDAFRSSAAIDLSAWQLIKLATSEVKNTAASVMSVADPRGLDAILSTNGCYPKG